MEDFFLNEFKSETPTLKAIKVKLNHTSVCGKSLFVETFNFQLWAII